VTDQGTIVTFVIVSFCLALILIMKKDSLPPAMRKGLALLALVMVVISFALVVYSFVTAADRQP
jgi:glucan phosphoethanolaminetransferase (alkaline phosphatase superfamily)